MSGELSEQAAAKILADLWALCGRIVGILAEAGIKPEELIICTPLILAAYAYKCEIKDVQGFAQSLKDGILITYDLVVDLMKNKDLMKK